MPTGPIWRVLLAAVVPLAAWPQLPVPGGPAPVPSATPESPAPAELVGRIQLKEKDGRVVPAEGSVVWVEGTEIARGAAPAPVIVSRDKRFAPHVVAVSQGDAVTFPNVDPIFHNAFSRTPGNEFDLGLYRRGARRTVRMRTPGVVRVYCNIHPEMAAFVVVVERAAHGVSGADGMFRVSDIPPGRRVVRVWSEKGGQQQSTVVFRPGARQRLDAVLDASAYRLLPHKNKYGKDYPPVTQDVDRY
jgi:plastocyanin